jgi:hypothetical protein
MLRSLRVECARESKPGETGESGLACTRSGNARSRARKRTHTHTHTHDGHALEAKGDNKVSTTHRDLQLDTAAQAATASDRREAVNSLERGLERRLQSQRRQRPPQWHRRNATATGASDVGTACARWLGLPFLLLACRQGCRGIRCLVAAPLLAAERRKTAATAAAVVDCIAHRGAPSCAAASRMDAAPVARDVPQRREFAKVTCPPA